MGPNISRLICIKKRVLVLSAQSDPFPMQIPLQHVPKGGIRWPELRVQIVKSVRPTTALFNERVCYINYGATYTGAPGNLRSRGSAGFQVSLF